MVAALMLSVSALQAQVLIPTMPDQANFGYGIQRTMRLLTTSTPTKRNTVRILFYGQSITEQKWAGQVTTWLRATYPNANLVIENRAIGGHSSQLLWRTAEADLYPFQPDLLIFYVYGSHLDYEKIITNVRKQTTAEILIQNEHLTRPEDMVEPTAPPVQSGPTWSAWMSEVFLPDLAKRFDAELLDQRKAWRAYLKANSLQPKDLLVDGVHLNDRGCAVMAEIVEQHFHSLGARRKAKADDMVLDLKIGQQLKWNGRRLKLEFEGSRVDVIASANANTGSVKVLVDGKPASTYATSRAQAYPGSNWPIVKRVSISREATEEEWTASLTDIKDEGKTFKFSISGSKTGLDGEGTSDKPFTSKSGKITIEPDDWNLEYCQKVFKRQIAEPLVTKWKVIPQFVNEYQPHPSKPAIENSTTLVQGLTNGKHTLELVATNESKPEIVSLRVYRPSLK